MAPIGIFITILAILALNNASDEYGSNVIILDDNNFDKEVITNSATDWLILFYAPWCKYCKEVMPIYEQIANDLLGKTYLAKVDVMAPGNRQLGSRFDISGFPTFKLIHNGQTFTYQGQRNYDDIKSFATGGYRLYESTATPGPPGYFGDIIKVYKIAYSGAFDDLKAGHWISFNIFVAATPFLLVLILAAGCLLPAPKWVPPPRRGADGRILRDDEPSEEAMMKEDRDDKGTIAVQPGKTET